MVNLFCFKHNFHIKKYIHDLLTKVKYENQAVCFSKDYIGIVMYSITKVFVAENFEKKLVC